jgi:hypothetical protein
MYTSHDPAGEAPRRAWQVWVALLLGGTLLGGAALLIFWQVVVHPPASASVDQYSPPRPPAPLTAAYYETVEGRIAQGLGLTVAQVKASIAADPNEGLFGVATVQGVSPDGLYTIETDALQAAGDQMVATGLWTQQQADTTMEYWRQRGAKALGSDMTNWFLKR